MALVQLYLGYVSFMQYSGTLELLAESLSIMVTYIQVVGRCYFYVFQQESCRKIVQNIREQRMHFGAKSNPAIEQLFHGADEQLVHLYRVLYWMYAAAMISFLSMPAIYPDPRKYNLPLAFTFPFLPVDNRFWWYFTYLYHFAMIWKCIHLLVVIDGVMVMAMMSVRKRIQALKVLLQQLDEKIQASPWKRTDHLELDLKRIIELHVSIKEFMRDFSDSYRWHFFMIAGTVCFEICMALNVIATTVRNPVYPYLLATTTQLLVMCFFGNVLLIENDTLSDCVYNIHWYRMTISQQKKIMFMVANAQPDMSANAIFLNVQMATFITIIRAAYSYFTILQ
ncbi:odorant receptor 4-like [Anopheles cruzii]|uniref:odorant receptor 4-like n=1 Tax=Anopheles cruzii TaxID=68878 RepID=UPI0022EC68B6|nr:odorant receptor 4-like [Anopheles cruzii]